MNRYLLLLLSVVIFAVSRASAATLMETCNRFSSADTINRCLQAGHGRSFDEKALDVCNRFSSSDTIIRCVEAVAGHDYDAKALDVCNRFSSADIITRCVELVADREYTAEEIATCNRFSSADSINQCLSSTGRVQDRRGGGRGRLSRCSPVVSEELQACRRYNRAPADVLDCLERAFGL